MFYPFCIGAFTALGLKRKTKTQLEIKCITSYFRTRLIRVDVGRQLDGVYHKLFCKFTGFML